MTASSENQAAIEEVTIPLETEASVKSSPGCCKCFTTAFASCCACFRNFLQITSIKGAKQIIGTKNRKLFIFWVFFVCLSFTLVITICSKVFLTYGKYNTVIRQSFRAVKGRDLPIVTMCSNSYFGDSPGIRELIKHQSRYEKFYENLQQKIMENRKFEEIDKYQQLRSINTYNLRNIHVWENFTKDILGYRFKELVGVTNLTKKDMECKSDHRLCVLKAFFNPAYRNCISASIRETQYETRKSYISIEGLLLRNRDDYGISQDNDNTFPSISQVDVLLHEPGDLPRKTPSFTFSLRRNRWVSVDLSINHKRRISTPRVSCLEEPIPSTTHIKYKVRKVTDVCTELNVRRLVRERCRCVSSKLPFDKWPLTNSSFCSVLDRSQKPQQVQCFYKYELSTEYSTKSPPCAKPCSERSYFPKTNINDITDDSLAFFLRNKFRSMASQYLKICKKIKISRCSMFLNVLKNLSKNVSLSYSDILRYKLSLAKAGEYWKNLKPPLTAIKDEKYDFIKHIFFIRIRIPGVSVLIESETLVQTIWTTLAQAGGACSFLAGFTFVVIAEVVDTCFTFCRQKRK